MLLVSDFFPSILIGKFIGWRSLRIRCLDGLLDMPKFRRITYLTSSDGVAVDQGVDFLEARRLNHVSDLCFMEETDFEEGGASS